MPNEEIPLCPECRSADVIPILYGLPTSEAFEMEQQGKVRLGGCMIDAESSRWECTACGTTFANFHAERDTFFAAREQRQSQAQQAQPEENEQ